MCWSGRRNGCPVDRCGKPEWLVGTVALVTRSLAFRPACHFFGPRRIANTLTIPICDVAQPDPAGNMFQDGIRTKVASGRMAQPWRPPRCRNRRPTRTSTDECVII